MHEPKRIESNRRRDGSWYCVDSFVIGAPPGAVFPVLADLGGYERFWPGVATHLAPAERVEAGAQGVMTVRGLLGTLHLEFVVEELVVGKRVRLLSARGDATGPLSIEVAGVDSSSRVTIIWDGMTPRSLGARLSIPRALHRCSTRGLKGLERFVAAQAANAPASAKRQFEWRGTVPDEKGA